MIFVLGATGYIPGAIALYVLFAKAHYRNAWFAFLPILSVIGVLHVIGKSGWNILWWLVPVANIIFAIQWGIDFLKVFGISPWWLLALLVPYLGTVAFLALYVYMAWSPAVIYDVRRIGRVAG